MKLVEECVGIGTLHWPDSRLGNVTYRIQRYQGMATSGLPIPGLHRIEGNIALRDFEDAAKLVGRNVTLELEDGRTLALTLADETGHVLAEGHGPGHGCGCC